jgi:hypothetical protein
LNELRIRWATICAAMLLCALLGGAAWGNGQGGDSILAPIYEPVALARRTPVPLPALTCAYPIQHPQTGGMPCDEHGYPRPLAPSVHTMTPPTIARSWTVGAMRHTLTIVPGGDGIGSLPSQQHSSQSISTDWTDIYGGHHVIVTDRDHGETPEGWVLRHSKAVKVAQFEFPPVALALIHRREAA